MTTNKVTRKERIDILREYFGNSLRFNTVTRNVEYSGNLELGRTLYLTLELELGVIFPKGELKDLIEYIAILNPYTPLSDESSSNDYRVITHRREPRKRY